MRSPEFGKEDKSSFQAKQSSVSVNNVACPQNTATDFRFTAQKSQVEEEEEEEINYESLFRQIQILQQLRDHLEIRPSVMTSYQASKNQGEPEIAIIDDREQQGQMQQAVEGLADEQRVQVQQLCQEWWDIT